MNGEEKNSIEKVENLIKRCDECKLKECINCETNYTEITSIKRIVDSYKRLLKENEQLKNDIENMYDEEVVISIIEDNFNLCRNEVLEVLGSEE